MAKRARSFDRNAALAQLHILKKDLGLDDDTYRDALERAVGARSAAKLSYAELTKVIGSFRAMRGGAPAMSAKAHVRKVWALWGELKREGIWREKSRSSLVTFCKKLTGKDNPDWMSAPESSRVIEALKKMKERGHAETS